MTAPMESISLPALTSTTANIPRLAIDAANELDEVLHGRLTESTSAKRLAEILTHSFSNGNNGKKTTDVTVKSGTIAVFCNALESLGSQPACTNFQDVTAEALKYAKNLSVGNPSEDRKAFENAKQFCIALAKAAAGYRQSVIGAQIRNRGR
jgi:hypothetical protein